MTPAAAAFMATLVLGFVALTLFVYRDRQHSSSSTPTPITVDSPPAAPHPPKPSLEDLANQLDELWTKRSTLTELAATCERPWPTDHAATLLTAWRNQTAS